MLGLVVYSDKNRRRNGRGKGLCEGGMNGFGLKYSAGLVPIPVLCDMAVGSAMMVAMRKGWNHMAVAEARQS